MGKISYFNEELLIKDRYPEFASWLVKGKENIRLSASFDIKLSNFQAWVSRH